MRKLGRMTKPWSHIVKEMHTEEVRVHVKLRLCMKTLSYRL